METESKYREDGVYVHSRRAEKFDTRGTTTIDKTMRKIEIPGHIHQEQWRDRRSN